MMQKLWSNKQKMLHNLLHFLRVFKQTFGEGVSQHPLQPNAAFCNDFEKKVSSADKSLKCQAQPCSHQAGLCILKPVKPVCMVSVIQDGRLRLVLSSERLQLDYSQFVFLMYEH